MRYRDVTIALCCTMVGTGGAAAQELELGGQVRPRLEFRSPDGFDTDPATEFVSMRSRLSLDAALERDVRVFVQFQDVRIWGEESSTTDPSANALDLHQGWVELGDAVEGTFALRVGRQELAYGEERLIGALDWVQQARSFDGARLRFRPKPVAWVEGFAMRLREDEVSADGDASLLGLYGAVDLVGTLDLYAIYNSEDAPPPELEDEATHQYTLGGRWASATGPVDWRVEAAYQTGERLGTDISAYLLALRAGAALGPRFRVDAWYDYLSGDDEPGDDDLKVFDTLFATNHKFYGYMDLFTDIPLHTNLRGLQDAVLKVSLVATPSLRLGADLHSFRYAAADGLESGHLGEELDLVTQWSYAPGVAVSGGLSWFTAGDGWADPDQTMSWLFVMLDVRF